jgi:membrane protease YdiL (CAAX protease family)
MSIIMGFIKNRPVLVYFILTFTISWGSFLFIIGGPGGIPATTDQFQTLLPFVIPLFIIGPCAAGLMMTGLTSGMAGFHGLISRVSKWRVGVGWYAIALLSAPVLFTAVHSALSFVSPVFLPGIITSNDKAALLLSGLAGGVIVGVLEEIGWTGFATTKLRLRTDMLSTGLILGVMWGAWHLLPHNFWAVSISSGDLSPVLFATLNGLSFLLGQLAAFRILMVWVYERTGSLLLAMLMHISLTTCTFILGPSSLTISGVSLLIYDVILAIAWWGVVLAVAASNRTRFIRHPILERSAH